MGNTESHSDKPCNRLGPRNRLIVLVLFALLVDLSLIRCTGAGIYSTIAISTKIDEGKLPDGISAGAVFHVTEASEYLFFVSGPDIWAKPISGSEWFAIGLYAGGMEWDGVQSAVATEDRIILALYSVSGNTYKVGLFALGPFDGSRAVYDDFDKRWISESRRFQTVRLFCPRPTGDIYVNVLNHRESYGSLDSDDNDFEGSSLYKLGNSSSTWGTATEITHSELNGTTESRYVTGVADNGSGTILVTATTGVASTNGGYLFELTGSNLDARGDGSIDNLYISTTGVIWIERNWTGHSGPGAFILAATSQVGGVHPIYASKDGDEWKRLQGASGSYRTMNFVDISDKTAGMNDEKHLVLAGTGSYIDGNRYKSGAGYNEIDVTNDDLTKWVVNTSRNSYSFANPVNYNVSKLSESTVMAMSIPDDGDVLYASTRNNGIWKVDLSKVRPSWSKE